MNTSPSRRTFLAATSLLGLGALGASARPALARPEPDRGASADDFPRQPAALVAAVVGTSHRSLDKVRELVTARPALAYAAYDWGFGDWESALGAASHTGRREIALFLMEHGARPDIFTFAMLGQLTAVKAMVEAHPGVQRILGPHGIPLLKHAEAGGEQATDVVDYLRSLGDADNVNVSAPLGAALAAYTGTYRVAGATNGGGLSFDIKENKGQLMFSRESQPSRNLFCVSGAAHEFHPAGARRVRLVFEMAGDKAAAVTIKDGDELRAVRAG